MSAIILPVLSRTALAFAVLSSSPSEKRGW